MPGLKLILNAFVIGALNLASFVIGFFIFHISASGEQRLVQGTSALLIAVSLVVLWLVYFRKVHHLQVEYDFIKVFLLVFVCTPVLFVPVHFLFTGYLTGPGNLIAVAAYQFPMNTIALSLAAGIIRHKEKAPRGAFPSQTNGPPVR